MNLNKKNIPLNNTGAQKIETPAIREHRGESEKKWIHQSRPTTNTMSLVTNTDSLGFTKLSL